VNGRVVNPNLFFSLKCNGEKFGVELTLSKLSNFLIQITNEVTNRDQIYKQKYSSRDESDF